MSLRRSAMVLFGSEDCPRSQAVRIVVGEKQIPCDWVAVDLEQPPEDLLEINPALDLPVLVDRDLLINYVPIALEYLDERFPHPPMMAVDPQARAIARTGLHNLERDWYGLLPEFGKGERVQARARKAMREQLLAIVPILSRSPYFFSQEFTLVDAYLAPLIWRLTELGVEIPEQARPLRDYAQRLFERPAFRSSLAGKGRLSGVRSG